MLEERDGFVAPVVGTGLPPDCLELFRGERLEGWRDGGGKHVCGEVSGLVAGCASSGWGVLVEYKSESEWVWVVEPVGVEKPYGFKVACCAEDGLTQFCVSEARFSCSTLIVEEECDIVEIENFRVGGHVGCRGA